MPLTFLFTRHGETADNLTKTLQGHRDTSLTENGHADATNLAQKLRTLYPSGIHAIYHSPLLRIRQTIAPYLDLCATAAGGGRGGQQPPSSSSLLPKPAVHADDDLKGQFLGPLEGKGYDSIDMGSPRSADVVEGVEIFDDFVARLLRVFGRIVAAEAAPLASGRDGRGEEEGEQRVVMIATHGVGITSLFKAMEASPACDNFGSAVARRGDGAYEVRWTDADDVARVRVESVGELVLGRDNEGRETVDWEGLRREGKVLFVIEEWGKKEKAL